MGNTISEEEAAMNVPQELPEAEDTDKYLNSGTDVPRCQPNHTQSELKQGQKLVIEEGLEVVMQERDEQPEVHLDDGKSQPLSPDHRKGSSVSDSDDDRRKRQHLTQSQQQQAAKKLSYVQMAKLGYQELVNAIIRPPRADYKVCL